MKWCCPSDYVGEERPAPRAPAAAPHYLVRTWSFPAGSAQEPEDRGDRVEEWHLAPSEEVRLQRCLVASLLLIAFLAAAILFLEPSWVTRLAAALIIVATLAGLVSRAATSRRASRAASWAEPRPRS